MITFWLIWFIYIGAKKMCLIRNLSLISLDAKWPNLTTLLHWIWSGLIKWRLFLSRNYLLFKPPPCETARCGTDYNSAEFISDSGWVSVSPSVCPLPTLRRGAVPPAVPLHTQYCSCFWIWGRTRACKRISNESLMTESTLLLHVFANTGCSPGVWHHKLPKLWRFGGLAQHGQEGQRGVWCPTCYFAAREQKWVLHTCMYTQMHTCNFIISWQQLAAMACIIDILCGSDFVDCICIHICICIVLVL